MIPSKITQAQAEELTGRQPLDTSHRIYTMPEEANIDEVAQLRADKASLLEAFKAASADATRLRADKAELLMRIGKAIREIDAIKAFVTNARKES